MNKFGQAPQTYSAYFEYGVEDARAGRPVSLRPDTHTDFKIVYHLGRLFGRAQRREKP